MNIFEIFGIAFFAAIGVYIGALFCVFVTSICFGLIYGDNPNRHRRLNPMTFTGNIKLGDDDIKFEEIFRDYIEALKLNAEAMKARNEVIVE